MKCIKYTQTHKTHSQTRINQEREKRPKEKQKRDNKTEKRREEKKTRTIRDWKIRNRGFHSHGSKMVKFEHVQKKRTKIDNKKKREIFFSISIYSALVLFILLRVSFLIFFLLLIRFGRFHLKTFRNLFSFSFFFLYFQTLEKLDEYLYVTSHFLFVSFFHSHFSLVCPSLCSFLSFFLPIFNFLVSGLCMGISDCKIIIISEIIYIHHCECTSIRGFEYRFSVQGIQLDCKYMYNNEGLCVCVLWYTCRSVKTNRNFNCIRNNRNEPRNGEWIIVDNKNDRTFNWLGFICYYEFWRRRRKKTTTRENSFSYLWLFLILMVMIHRSQININQTGLVRPLHLMK